MPWTWEHFCYCAIGFFFFGYWVKWSLVLSLNKLKVFKKKLLSMCQSRRRLWTEHATDSDNQKFHSRASLDLSWCLLHINMAHIEKGAPDWLRLLFLFFFFPFSPLIFASYPASFQISLLISLFFFLVPDLLVDIFLFKITYGIQLFFFWFHPHLIFF